MVAPRWCGDVRMLFSVHQLSTRSLSRPVRALIGVRHQADTDRHHLDDACAGRSPACRAGGSALQFAAQRLGVLAVSPCPRLQVEPGDPFIGGLLLHQHHHQLSLSITLLETRPLLQPSSCRCQAMSKRPGPGPSPTTRSALQRRPRIPRKWPTGVRGADRLSPGYRRQVDPRRASGTGRTGLLQVARRGLSLVGRTLCRVRHTGAHQPPCGSTAGRPLRRLRLSALRRMPAAT